MQNFEFMLHQIISTTVLKRFWPQPEISTSRKKSYMLSFPAATGCVLRTELWNQHLGFTGQSELSEYLPASKSIYARFFSGTDCPLIRGKPSPHSNTPKRAERYDLHLALAP